LNIRVTITDYRLGIRFLVKIFDELEESEIEEIRRLLREGVELNI
jgi:hypothetical protein